MNILREDERKRKKHRNKYEKRFFHDSFMEKIAEKNFSKACGINFYKLAFANLPESKSYRHLN